MKVTTTYLEQRSPEDLRPAAPPTRLPRIELVGHPTPEFARFLYATVGGDWHWHERLTWSRERWRARVADPLVRTHVAWLDGSPAGYVELAVTAPTEVEIAYFGLLPGFLGMGLGGHLLTEGLRRAWAFGTVSRVWVHTCDLDAPAALANYQARGMTVYQVTETEQQVPATGDGPWSAGAP